MAYVVNEKCIKCKLTDCVEICPVDCFHEGLNMLVINPDPCIDCGLCEPECPVGAIRPGHEPESLPWLDLNQRMAMRWPGIMSRRDPLPDADTYRDVPGKYALYFSNEPGEGN